MMKKSQQFATRVILILPVAAFLHSPPVASAGILGSAVSFGVLAGQTVTNTGATTINGNLGVWPGSAYTGGGTVTQTGTVYLANGVAQAAEGDVTNAYNYLAGLPVNTVLTGQDLGGQTLLPGVYFFASGAGLTGTLTLNATGVSNALFVFQIGTSLITAPNAAVNVIGGDAGTGVFWQVGSSATVDTGTAFEGNILALTSISLNTGATDCGRVLARNGQVSMQANSISNSCGNAVDFGSGAFAGDSLPPAPASVPEPGTVLSVCLGLFALAFKRQSPK
jgi:type VI secretion system secreted protein VgrG